MSEIKITLQDVADVIDCEHKTAPIDDNGEYRSVRTSDLRKGKILHRQCNKVSKETYDNWTKRRIPKSGDIILSREAPVGEIGYVEKDETYCLGQRTVLISPKNQNIHGRFLSYFLQTNEAQEEMSSRSAGSVVTHLNMSEIRNLTIPQIDIKNQIQIAEVLSSLDDKIDLLHRNNKTLEEMAETLFRQWFVEGAKEEWEEVKLGDYIKLESGYSYRSVDLNPSTNALVTLKNFNRSGGFRLDGFKEYTGKYKNEQLVKMGDLIVAHTDITQEADLLGNPAIVIDDGRYEKLVISTDLVKVVPNSFLSKTFLYYLMRQPDFKHYCLGLSNGTTVLHLSKKALPDYEFRLPKEKLVNMFTSTVEPVFEKIGKNIKHIHQLESLRDTLLPKLMSGQVRVKIDK